jgi:hypothetical protein
LSRPLMSVRDWFWNGRAAGEFLASIAIVPKRSLERLRE